MNTASAHRALFIYYRVAQANLELALQAARAVQFALTTEVPGLQTALWRRPDAKDGEVTMMECYSTDAGIDAVLAERIEVASAPSGPWRSGDRHVEVFERL